MTIDRQALELLRSRHRGPVLTPSDARYDGARRIWNARFDRRPAAVARAGDAGDVVAAVGTASESGLLLAVKSGGHDYAGKSVCDGGLVVDLSGLTEIRVDPEVRRAHVQPGVRWGELDRQTQAFGLATTGGTVSTVGVAGFTLGGGNGNLSRKHGLALDNLLSVEVVTADGTILRADSERNPDLFWALRGGSGNFGVVTSFEFALHPVGPSVLTAQIFYPLELADRVLRAYRDFMIGAPDELQCYAFFFRVPETQDFPRELHGNVVLDLVTAYAGDPDRGREVITPLREAGRSALEIVEVQPYTVAQQAFDAGVPAGLRWHSRAHYLNELSDDAIDLLAGAVGALPGTHSMAYLSPEGGAIARLDATATAFPHRDASFSLHILAGWSDSGEDSEIVEWVDGVHAAMAAHATGAVYVNLLGDGEDGRVTSAYGVNYDRLSEIKRTYDPRNLFRHNHNIEPAVR